MSKKNDFSMDYDALKKLAEEVCQMQEDFEKMRKQLGELADSLDGQWQGKAQAEFSSAYKKLQPKLTTISEVLSDYATEITNAANGEKELESFNKTLFKPIDYLSF